MNCLLFLALSLDGYVARCDGSLDWLEKANERITPGVDLGFHSFLASVDVLVMGRKTFEQVLGFNEWPYNGLHVVVLTRQGINIPPNLQDTVSTLSGEPHEIVAHLSAKGYKNAYIDGAETIQRFLQAGLIDEMTLTVVPILIGQGKTLFAPLTKDIPLKLIEAKPYDFGYIQLKYSAKMEEGSE